MPKFSVSDPATGQTLVLEGDSPPTEDELKEVFTQNSLRESYAKGAARLRGQDRFSRFIADQSAAGAGPALLQEAQRGTGEAIQGAGALTTIPVVGPGATYSPAMSQMGTELAKRYAEATPSERRRAIEENPIVIAGKALSDVAAETHPVPPEAEQAWLTKAARTVGGFVLPVATRQFAPITIALQSAGAHLDADFNAAKAENKTDDEAAQIAFKRAAASGLTQAAIWAIMPQFLRRASDKFIIDKFAKPIGEAPVRRFLLGRAASTAEMGTLGAVSGGAEAAISGQPIAQGVGEGATGMGIIGLLSPHGYTRREIESPEMQARMEAARRRRVFGKEGAAAITEAAEAAQRGRPPTAAGVETEAPRVFFPRETQRQPYVPPEPGVMDVREPGFPRIPSTREQELEQQIGDLQKQILFARNETERTSAMEQLRQARLEYEQIEGAKYATGIREQPSRDLTEHIGTTPRAVVPPEPPPIRGEEGARDRGGGGDVGGAPAPEAQPPAPAVVSVEQRKTYRRKLAENMQGRFMEISPTDYAQGDAHLRLVLGKNAPSWQQLEAIGLTRSEPGEKGMVRVSLKPEAVTGETVPPVIRDVAPGSIDPNAIVPAIRLIGGQVVPGKVTDDINKKDIHNDIIDRHKIDAHDIDQKGFSDPSGTKFFLDREAAAVGTGAPTAFEPDRLHAPDLAKAQTPVVGSLDHLAANIYDAADRKGELITPAQAKQRAIDRAIEGYPNAQEAYDSEQEWIAQGRGDEETYTAEGFAVTHKAIAEAALARGAKPALPTPATSGSVVPAATETITAQPGVAAPPEAAAVPGPVGPTIPPLEGERAPEMAAGTGSIPLRSAADLRSAIDTLNKKLRADEAKAKQLRKAKEDQSAKRYERRAARAREQLTILQGELSRVVSEEPKKPVSIARGVSGLTRFNNETETFGDDLLAFIAAGNRLMSKTQAQKTHSAEWWTANKSLWDDAPSSLASSHHNVIYGGQSTPDQVARDAVAAGYLPDGSTERELWQAISKASSARKGNVEDRARQERLLKREVEDHERWLKAIQGGKDKVEVASDTLNVGDQLDIGGERFEVTKVDPDTEEVTLKDGRKFGVQVLSPNARIYVEKFEPAPAEEGGFPAPEPVTAPAAPAEQPPVAGVPAGAGAAPAPAKPVGPAVDLFGTPIEPVKAAEPPKGPQEVQDMLGLAPAAPKPAEVQERPLTPAEQKEFLELSKIFKKWREEGGEKPTTAETQRYEHLLALAGQKTFGLELPEGGKPALRNRLERATRELEELELQAEGKAVRGKSARQRFEKMDALRHEIEMIESDLTEGEGEIVLRTPIAENPNNGMMESQEFRLRQLTSQEYLKKFPDVQWRIREFPNIYEPWVAESRRLYYSDDGKTLERRDAWYRDAIAKTREEAMQIAGSYSGRTAAKWKELAEAPKAPEKPAEAPPVEAPKPTPIRYAVTSSGAARGGWKVMEVLSDNTQREYQGRIQTKAEAQSIRDAQNEALKEKGQYQSLDDQVAAEQPPEPTPLTPAQSAVVSEAVKAAFPEGGAPEGSRVGKFEKRGGRWYNTESKSKIPIPLPLKQHQLREAEFAAPPAPPETRTPTEILNQAAKVRVKVPPGATKIRVWADATHKSEISLAEINTGDNIIRGSGIVKVEAGHIDKNGKFAPIAGDVSVEDVGKRPKAAPSRAEPKPLLYREKALKYGSVDDLRKAVTDPDVPLGDDIRKSLTWLLNQKFVDQLPGVSFEIGDYMDGSMSGEYLPDKPLIRFLRFTDTDVPIHEFLHHVRMYLRPDDAAFMGELRRSVIQDEIAKAKDIADQRFLRELLNNPLESDEFFARDGKDNFYHLTNDHEFFVWMMTDKAQREMNRPEAVTFVAKVRQLIQQLINWARDTFGFAPYQETLARQILSGQYEFNIDDAVRFGNGTNQRKLSLPLDPKDYELRSALNEIGHQAATIGGYLHRYEVQQRLANEMNVSEKARALDHVNKAREMTEIALEPGGKINYYDGRDNAATLGEKNEVIRSAFESVTRYQQLGMRLHRMLEEKTRDISSPRFHERLIRAAEKREKAELLAEVKRTFVNQISASAGRITATLESMRLLGTRADQLIEDLDRLRKMPDYSNAVAQKVDDIVNLLSTDDQGISKLMAGGNKSGSDIFDSYMARVPLTGQPMPTGDSISLLRLASAVLAANRDLRNEFTVLNLVARDVISASDVNEAGRQIAKDLLHNPAKAVQRVVRRAALITDKATRAEAAWLALNRPIQRLISQWNMYDEAVRLHDAVENDAEYRQYVNDVNADSGGLYIPNEIRQKLAAPESPTREPFFEFSGVQTLYAPDGQEFQINIKWNRETVGETMSQLALLKAKIDDWMEAPENANSPARTYWQERQRHIESALMSSAVWNPSAITPFHIGKWGFGAWGMPETFYQGLALPQAKLAFIATKNFDRLWTQGKGWYSKYQPVAERLTELAYKSHPEFNETTRKDYQRTLMNVIGWEFRHQREVHVGDVLNGVTVTKEDLDLFHAEARQMSELYDILWKAGNLSGAADVMELPRIIDEFSGGAWGIRRTMEIGINRGTTLPRSFSKHGENLAVNVHLIVEARDKALSELPAKAVNMTPEEVQAERADITQKFHDSMTQLLNDPDRFNNFVLGFMRQRSSDWLKHQGLSPFEEHYRQMTDLVSSRDPSAPGIVDEVFDFLQANSDADWTLDAIKGQFFGEITKLTEQIYKMTAEHKNSNTTVMSEKHETAFNRAFAADVGPSYFYDYGWIDAGEMRKYSTDMASFAFDRMMASMHALRRNMSEAIAEMTRSALPWKAEQIRQVKSEYEAGKDFRDLQHLEDKLLELDRMIQGVQKWMGSTAMYAEGISLKTGSRVVSDFIGMALTGLRTVTRISGVSMGGSAWKMGNVYSQLGWGKLRSTPAAALSAIISASRVGTSTMLGWYFPESKKLVPGIPLRMVMNIPKAAKAALKAKGGERFYQALEKGLEGVTDEQFAALRFWFDQKQLGMTPDNPIGSRMANIISASRTKGGILRGTPAFTESVLGKAWRGGKLVGSKVVAGPEAGLAFVMSYLPTGFGYNITYDAVGRQAGWYIDMLAAHSRRTFETYEKLNQLGRFNFDNPQDTRNRLAPWEVLPSFIGKMTFINPMKLPAWARPTSTNLHFARELFSTSTDVDLQDLVLRYWKRLSQTPRDQRGAIEFLAPEEMDPAAAAERAAGRARGVISRFVEQTHHAAPSNRPYQLQRATAFQSIMPFLGWSSQTIKQLGTYFGQAAYSAESQGRLVDSRIGLLLATGLSALLVGAFAFLGGDFEVRLLRQIDRLFNRKETSLKTVDEVDTAKEKAEIVIHNMTAGIPLLNSALNTITGATGYRGTYGFQAFIFDKVNAIMNYVRGVYRTHDVTYGLERLAEANIPISETIIENLFERQGLQNSRNAVRVLQKFGPQDLVERRASASVSLPTELTPYRQNLINAVFSGKPELAQEAYQAFVQKATELGRTDPEAVARQVFGTLNPYRQAFGSLITDQQRAEAVSRMSDTQRDMLTKAETAYSAAALALGLPASFTKEESVSARGTRGAGVSGVSAAPAATVPRFGTGVGGGGGGFGVGVGGRLRGGSAISLGGAGRGIGATRYRGAGIGRLRAGRSGRISSRRLSGAFRRPKSFVRGRLRARRPGRSRLAGFSRLRRRGVYA